jgi:membrane-associated protease RseP (regulator of RpoE activity)
MGYLFAAIGLIVVTAGMLAANSAGRLLFRRATADRRGWLIESLAGLAGTYLFNGFLCALALGVGARSQPDETSMRVVVAAAGPAEQAGMRDGDRIVSVASQPTGDWDTLKSVVAAHRDQDVDVAFERGGAPMTVHAHVGPDGRLRVGPPMVVVRPGVADLAKAILVEPAQVLGLWMHDLVVGSGERTEVGPVGIVSFSARQAGFGAALLLLAHYTTYFIPIAALMGFALSRHRRAEKSARTIAAQR